jgi:hypothetical protein
MEPDPGRGDFVRQLVPDLARAVTAGVAMRFRWWMPSIAVGAVSAGLFFLCAMSEARAGWFETRSAGWWVLTTALHLPFLWILVFLWGDWSSVSASIGGGVRPSRRVGCRRCIPLCACSYPCSTSTRWRSASSRRRAE